MFSRSFSGQGLLGSAMLGLGFLATSAATSAGLPLEHAIQQAIKHDPWLQGNASKEQALLSRGEAASHLPDPVLSADVANLPTDGFAFDQQDMTQLRVGIAQRIPRGDTLSLRQKWFFDQATQHPHERENRKMQLRMTIAQHWLEAQRAAHTLALLEKERSVFEQLIDIAQASYASAQGNTRQQDVVRAQVALTRLDDRITALYGQFDVAQTRLLEWLPHLAGNATITDYQSWQSLSVPQLSALPEAAEAALSRADLPRLSELLSEHPALMAKSSAVRASETGVALSKQGYKPQWGVSASYAYRDERPDGQSRADFFSVGLTLEMPLFGADRQDHEVSAARHEAESLETEKRLLLRQMLAQWQRVYQQEKRLAQREIHFRDAILPQLQEQAEASLTAYTNDDGSAADAVLARIDQLNARVDAIALRFERLKTQSHLFYFLPTQSGSPRA